MTSAALKVIELERISAFDEWYANLDPERQRTVDAWMTRITGSMRQFGPYSAKELLAVVLSHKATFDRINRF